MDANPTLSEIRAAARRISPHAHRTPILTCRQLNDLTEAALFFKCENFQKVGAFKFRGACNAVFALPEEQAVRGVMTHSSGNHGAALALAAQRRGIRAHVVMPTSAPEVKRQAVGSYGARIVPCEPTLAAREETAARIFAETGATLIHPYNNHEVICGQGTAALELLTDQPQLDVVITPVGGGGLLSGTALAVKGLSPQTRVIAAEPAGADDAMRSLAAGKIIPQTAPRTIADGLLTSLAPRTFRVIREHVEQIVIVTDAQIVRAMRLVWERMKIIIEPSAAVPVAALLERKIATRGLQIGIILSGGNVDLDRLPWTN